MIWKSVNGWPYEVSDAGLVRRQGGRPLKPMRTGAKRKQYSVVSLCRGGKECRVKVHVLVLETFVGPRPPGMLALHNDDDTTNNFLTNLYWGSGAENADDCRFTNSKLTPIQVRQIKQRRTDGDSGRGLAIMFGVSEQFICDIYKGRSYP